VYFVPEDNNKRKKAPHGKREKQRNEARCQAKNETEDPEPLCLRDEAQMVGGMSSWQVFVADG
jgi:hypothetical protein